MSRHGYGLRKGTRCLRFGRFSCKYQIYHITTATHQRAKLLDNLDAARAVVNALRRACRLGQADTLAYVVMPDHFHWLMQLTGDKSLSVTVNTVKSLSAREINRASGNRGAVWQKGYFDRGLRHDEDIVTIARYIIANPLRAGIVDRPGDYPFWDAIWI